MLKIDNLTYKYGSKVVLNNINLSVEQGEFLGIVGKDGAGKTTLFHLIMDFQHIQKGDIKIRGDIRFVSDNLIMEDTTARDYLSFLSKTTEEYNGDRQWGMCQMFDIDIDDYLQNMTQQDNKMVQLIGAISSEPAILIIDEPLNFLSKEMYCEFMDYLKSLSEEGATIIVSAKKAEHVKSYCNRYICLTDDTIPLSDRAVQNEILPKVVMAICEDRALLDARMTKFLFEKDGRAYYYFNGNMPKLLNILQLSRCTDFAVEEMTLEEAMHMDFSRWEQQC